MNSVNSEPRTIETSISTENVKAQIAAFLYATGLVHDNESVDFDLPWKGDLIPLKLKVKKEQEVSNKN